MDCTVFFITSFLVPITLGLPSFIDDSRKASIYLVFVLIKLIGRIREEIMDLEFSVFVMILFILTVLLIVLLIL